MLSVKSLVDKCPELRKLDVRDHGVNGAQYRTCKINDVEYAMAQRPDLEVVPSGRTEFDEDILLNTMVEVG